ncbi:MAG: hypothetical protein ABR976_20920 [Terracidiphilus sp.]|jgi:hypothetical protein
MNSTRVLVLIFSFSILQGCQTPKPACAIQQGQDSQIADLQRQKDDTLCEIQLRQAELDRITAAVNARGAAGASREGLGRKAEADLTEKITQLRTKVHDLDFQMAATALANFNSSLSQAKLALQQHSEILKDPKNSAAQVGLIATFLRAVAGGQSTRERITSLDDEIMNLVRPVTGGHSTGERITKAQWEAATVACPCLAGIEPRFGPDGYMIGATISQGQATQMLGAMRDNAKAAVDTYNQLKKSVDNQMQADMEAAGLGDKVMPAPKQSGKTYDEEIMKLLHPQQ